VKYGRSGTDVVVEGSRSTAADRVVLTVANSGVPIPPEELDRIWNRLYRGGSAGDRRDGLGLGLALVRAIVEAHGGEASVESDEARGTRFRVSVPSNVSKV